MAKRSSDRAMSVTPVLQLRLIIETRREMTAGHQPVDQCQPRAIGNREQAIVRACLKALHNFRRDANRQQVGEASLPPR